LKFKNRAHRTEDRSEIGPGSDIAPLPFVENGSIGKFDKSRFIQRLHCLSGSRKACLPRLSKMPPRGALLNSVGPFNRGRSGRSYWGLGIKDMGSVELE